MRAEPGDAVWTGPWRRMAGARGAVLCGAIVGAAGCAGAQSALDPQGPSAGAVAQLWWVLLGMAVFVQLAVTFAVIAALLPRERPTAPDLLARRERTKRYVVTGAAAATLAVLVVLVVASVVTDRAVSRLPAPGSLPIVVRVIAHQWWWEVVYLDDTPSRTFTTANELHVPVGRPVVVHLESRDVIHSFWVPNLAGKTDVMPGRRNTMWFQADTAGTYRGQCAEFCGLQHAKMAFVVVAEDPDRYEAWAEAYRQPPPLPETELARQGQQVFLDAQCALCHRVRGTDAWGTIAPDLSRIGTRTTLAAASLPNSRANMARWIADPQGIKPGTFMPPTALDPHRLDALLAYLEALQ